MSSHSLLTFSEVGLHLLRSIFDLQRLLGSKEEVKQRDKERAAILLRKMANCLKEIYDELQVDEPRHSKHAGSMTVHLRDFKKRFAPLIGEDIAQGIQQDIAILFESEKSEDNLSLFTGFVALKKFQREGAIDKQHADAAISALFLAIEQLEATADTLEFG